MTFKKILPLLIILFAIPALLKAQVTTSSISGSVKQSNGQPLAGATITAVHTPSGTKYETVSTKSGVFTMPGLRPGGPYTLSCQYSGMKKQDVEDITLTLGDNYTVNLTMVPMSTTLTEVVVSGGRAASNQKTGASTNVGQRQIVTLPTITRNITDFTRLTPQSNGNSIGGRDGRYNNFTVDGANLNNNFGLSSDPLPGGNSQPISLDAIEEVSVNIAPTDVRQSNFTGGNIAAVTKSGTNMYKATVYGYYRDQSFIGRNVGGLKLATPADQKSTVYGASVGGPIIKNKLFFFVNGELEKRTAPPLTSFKPTGGSGGSNISNVKVDSLKRFSDYLRSAYGYETGSYDGLPNAEVKNYKFLVRLDWNINTTHKLTLKYSEMVGDDDRLMSNSAPNGAATGGPNTWSANARFGTNAMSFANSQYSFHDQVRTAAVELNSNWRGKFSNQFIATGTKIRTTRSTPGGVFPFIDIMGDPTKSGAAATYAGGARQNYMSAGQENFSNNNDVKNDIYNITNNFTIYRGKHTATIGGNYEYQYVGNMFMPASQSYYAFGSLEEFMTPNAHPIGYAYTFSRIAGKETVYSAEMKIGQLGLYVQDEININPRLKLTLGVRADRPIYPTQPLENPAITALSFPDRYGKPTNYSTGKWPKAIWYWAPRFDVRWDMNGDKSMIVRGGSGVYTGRIPFVYLTNMPTNSGMYQVSVVANATQLSQITFNTNPTAWASLFTAPAPVPNSAGFVLIDPNYKFPQVWRTNVGFDKRFGKGWTLNMDLLYTKDLNATVMRNANEIAPTGTVNLGGSTRPSFSANTTTARRLYNGYANAIVLENNNAGGSFSLTAAVSKSFSKGFYASLAYTYSMAMDVTSNPGSTASSTWGGNPTTGTQNTKELSYSSFAVPHRIIGTFSYRREFLKHLGTTISLFYEGSQQQGGRFSYIYGAAGGTAPSGFSNTADINYDGNSSDLMYIPKDPSQITFIPVTVGSGSTARTYTAQEQSDAFFRFIEQDKYLRKHKGMVAERNGVLFPFYHRVDLKFLQDIFTNIGSRRMTLQFSADCQNFLNLLNKDWGLRDFFVVNNPLRATKNATTGEVRYQLATYTPNDAPAGSNPILVDKTFIRSASTTSTWSLQLGLRLIF
ncbi:MAG TPA: carboxypeptidase regulatory-like domain-containing protein [Ferruginibacter sp.]|nr:carboxypeptidase regulatory-like domain-containing protein [Ferruginibacter sp.]